MNHNDNMSTLDIQKAQLRELGLRIDDNADPNFVVGAWTRAMCGPDSHVATPRSGEDLEDTCARMVAERLEWGLPPLSGPSTRTDAEGAVALMHDKVPVLRTAVVERFDTSSTTPPDANDTAKARADMIAARRALGGAPVPPPVGARTDAPASNEPSKARADMIAARRALGAQPATPSVLGARTDAPRPAPKQSNEPNAARAEMLARYRNAAGAK